MRTEKILYEIAPLSDTDIEQVLEIERNAFPYPWSRAIFTRELSYDWSHLIGRIEADTGKLVAFVNYWLVYDEVHVLNIATHPAYRRRGHARALLEHVIAFARMHRCSFVTLEVRRSNLGAQALYRFHGFKQVGVRPRYYVEDGEDALVMVLSL
jgi:ribosomal-protein-alanine N-acetyltransferase